MLKNDLREVASTTSFIDLLAATSRKSFINKPWPGPSPRHLTTVNTLKEIHKWNFGTPPLQA